MTIKELRLDKGLTQTQIAEALGVTQHMWSMWETGNREPINVYKQLIADFFGVEAEDLW